MYTFKQAKYIYRLSLVLLITVLTTLSACTDDESNTESNNELSTEKNAKPAKEKITFIDGSNKVLSPAEYKNWVLKNLVKEQTVQDTIYRVLYKPLDYIVCLEQTSLTVTNERLNILREELVGLEYFDLRIGSAGDKNELGKHKLNESDDYEQRLKYYAFEFQHDISLITSGGDTIHPALFHFERAFDLAPFSTFSLGFPKDQINYEGNLTFIVNDAMSDCGAVIFTFSGKQFHSLPKLKTI